MAYHTSYKHDSYTVNREISAFNAPQYSLSLSQEYAFVPSRLPSKLLIGFSMTQTDIFLFLCSARFPVYKPQSPGRTGDYILYGCNLCIFMVVIYVFLLEEAIYSYCYLCILIDSLC